MEWLEATEVSGSLKEVSSLGKERVLVQVWVCVRARWEGDRPPVGTVAQTVHLTRVSDQGQGTSPPSASQAGRPEAQMHLLGRRTFFPILANMSHGPSVAWRQVLDTQDLEDPEWLCLGARPCQGPGCSPHHPRVTLAAVGNPACIQPTIFSFSITSGRLLGAAELTYLPQPASSTTSSPSGPSPPHVAPGKVCHPSRPSCPISQRTRALLSAGLGSNPNPPAMKVDCGQVSASVSSPLKYPPRPGLRGPGR